METALEDLAALKEDLDSALSFNAAPSSEALLAHQRTARSALTLIAPQIAAQIEAVGRYSDGKAEWLHLSRAAAASTGDDSGIIALTVSGKAHPPCSNFSSLLAAVRAHSESVDAAVCAAWTRNVSAVDNALAAVLHSRALQRAANSFLLTILLRPMSTVVSAAPIAQHRVDFFVGDHTGLYGTGLRVCGTVPFTAKMAPGAISCEFFVTVRVDVLLLPTSAPDSPSLPDFGAFSLATSTSQPKSAPGAEGFLEIVIANIACGVELEAEGGIALPPHERQPHLLAAAELNRRATAVDIALGFGSTRFLCDTWDATEQLVARAAAISRRSEATSIRAGGTSIGSILSSWLPVSRRDHGESGAESLDTASDADASMPVLSWLEYARAATPKSGSDDTSLLHLGTCNAAGVVPITEHHSDEPTVPEGCPLLVTAFPASPRGGADKASDAWRSGALGVSTLPPHATSPGIATVRPGRELGSWRIVQIACSERHSAALAVGGALFTWGSGVDGALGIEGLARTASNVDSPRLVPFFGVLHPLRALAVACGADSAAGGKCHTLVIAAGLTSPEAMAAQAASRGRYASELNGVSLYTRGLRVAQAGRVFAFGAGAAAGAAAGAVGDSGGDAASDDIAETPRLVEAEPGCDMYSPFHGGIATVSAGGSCSAILTRSGALYTWGSTRDGRVGLGEDGTTAGTANLRRQLHRLRLWQASMSQQTGKSDSTASVSSVGAMPTALLPPRLHVSSPERVVGGWEYYLQSIPGESSAGHPLAWHTSLMAAPHSESSLFRADMLTWVPPPAAQMPLDPTSWRRLCPVFASSDDTDTASAFDVFQSEGSGSGGERGHARLISLTIPIRSVSCGAGGACTAADAWGRLWAWGRNTDGEAGIHSRANLLSPVPVIVAPSEAAPNGKSSEGAASESVVRADAPCIVRVANGAAHGLGIDAAGAVWRWGAIGGGAEVSAGGGAHSPCRMPLLGNGPSSCAVSIAAGDGFDVILTASGRVHTLWAHATGSSVARALDSLPRVVCSSALGDIAWGGDGVLAVCAAGRHSFAACGPAPLGTTLSQAWLRTAVGLAESLDASFVPAPDVALVLADGLVLYAHRCILASRSPVLADRLLTAVPAHAVSYKHAPGGVRPARTQVRLHTPDLTFSTGVQLLHFLYAGTLAEPVTPCTAQATALMHASEAYGLPELKTICARLVSASAMSWLRQLQADSAYLAKKRDSTLSDDNEFGSCVLGAVSDRLIVAPACLRSPVPETLSVSDSDVFATVIETGLAPSMRRLLSSGAHADVSLLCAPPAAGSDKRAVLPAHSFVIASRSPVFATALGAASSVRSAEAAVAASVELQLPDAPLTIARMLFFLYTGCVAPLPSHPLDFSLERPSTWIPGCRVACSWDELVKGGGWSDDAFVTAAEGRDTCRWSPLQQLCLDAVAARRYGVASDAYCSQLEAQLDAVLVARVEEGDNGTFGLTRALEVCGAGDVAAYAPRLWAALMAAGKLRVDLVVSDAVAYERLKSAAPHVIDELVAAGIAGSRLHHTPSIIESATKEGIVSAAASAPHVEPALTLSTNSTIQKPDDSEADSGSEEVEDASSGAGGRRRRHKTGNNEPGPSSSDAAQQPSTDADAAMSSTAATDGDGGRLGLVAAVARSLWNRGRVSIADALAAVPAEQQDKLATFVPWWLPVAVLPAALALGVAVTRWPVLAPIAPLVNIFVIIAALLAAWRGLVLG